MSGRPLSRRSVLSGLGAVAGGAVAAACGSNTGGVATSNTTASAAAAGSAAPSAAASATGTASATSGGGSSGPVAQWYHQYGETGVEAAVKRYAAAYTPAKVEVDWILGDYGTKLSAGLLSSSGPDVFENQLTTAAVAAGQYADLTDIMAPVKGDFIESALELATVDGKIYGVPMIQDMQLLYYRKSLLAAAKVAPPTTLDELIEAAKALTTKKVKGFFAGNDGGAGVLGPMVLFAEGADYVDATGKANGFSTQAAYTGMSKLRSLYTSGSLLLGAPTDWSDPGALVNGLCAMQWTGLWTYPVLSAKFGDDLGVLPFPKDAPTAKASVPVGDYNQMVSAKAKDVEAAKAYVKWLWIDQTADQLDFAQSYGFHIPPRKSIAAKADKLKTGTAAQIVRFATDLGRPTSPVYWTGDMGTAFSDAVTKIVQNGSSPESELTTAAKVVDKALAT